MSSNLSPIFQITSRANNYSIPSLGLTNQSANSNFILIIPFLFIPTLIILFKQYKKTRKIKDWILLFTLILFAFLCIRIFIPKFDSIYKLILLDQVSAKRMLIGFGVLNVLFIASYIKYTSIKNNKSLSYNFVYIYVLLIFIIELLLGYHARQQHPGFIDFKTSLLLSFPIPIVVYLFLTNNIKVALYILLGFSVFSSGLVNPLYKGTGILKDTELSRQIRALDDIAPESIWATESIYIENFASLNGAKSLSGVYSYPQLELWNPLKTNTDADYNRYAHVNFAFDRDSATHIDSYIKLLGADNFQVVTEPCSNFITANKVRYIVTVAMLDNTASCAQLVKEIVYPKQNYFIYELSY